MINATGVVVDASVLGRPTQPYLPTEQHSSAVVARLPADLATQRLNVRAPLGSARFLPGSHELLTAVFATWNVLDALMHVREPHSAFQTGYLRELQVRRMLQLVRAPAVKNYCEVGMNGGHSLSAMLLARPDLHANVFDLFKWQYSRPLNSTFPGRIVAHVGYSQDTLPPFVRRARAAGVTCDLALVDGGHTDRAARLDVRHLQLAATPDTRVVMDDIGMPGPGVALKQLNRSGVLIIEEMYGPFPRRSLHSPCMRAPAGTPKERARSGRMCPPWGFAVARYRRPGRMGHSADERAAAGGA